MIRHHDKTGLRIVLLTIVLFCGDFSNSALGDEGTDAIKRGRVFLADLLDPALNLIPEYRGSPVYWLYHDNYLAAKVLAPSNPVLTKKIGRAISEHGASGSGKIEILFAEASAPLPFRQYELVEVKRLGDKMIRTERVTDRPMRGWEAYADLRFMAAIALAESDAEQARQQFAAGIDMWDDTGLDDPATKAHHIYSTYKLALAVIAAASLDQMDQVPPAMIDKLKSMQAESGGWITDYKPDGTPVGKANVETSCLAILALEAIETQTE